MTENNIQNLRDQIDKLDDQLLELLDTRMEYVKKIGFQKIKNNMSIYRPDREKEILTRLKKNKTLHLDSKAIDAIFLEIFAISRNPGSSLISSWSFRTLFAFISAVVVLPHHFGPSIWTALKVSNRKSSSSSATRLRYPSIIRV